MENIWYHLDPDNRVEEPKNYDHRGRFIGYKPNCCRCHKAMKSSAGVSFRCVTVDWDNMQIRNDPFGKDLIGEDCWNQVTKNPVN